MTAQVRRQICALVAAAAIPLAGAGTAEAAVVAPGTAQVQNTGDTANDDHDNGNNGLWGLLGLVGLLGLAGLVRRGPKPGAMAGYPAAPDRQAPPANTYPPAGPRREPPGV
ncbi:WGxxGxxG family protein [Amycolatopsis sp. Poz14]|uniref:WGxxGxxG family protein n=1 Tax=Amycolatopsis sp. Poz14 TaxID=1447705 RepID=UPI001EE80C82|nr:WGxxGxxG family protein [Amycolatopsis sp. Poz14]MCG3752508.1 hypothetical protein [Amycolatopsis sp. Poz14]